MENNQSKDSPGDELLSESSEKDNSQVQATHGRQSLRKVGRLLTDDELATPGARKLLLDMLEETEREREELKHFMTNYYQADKQVGILTEKLKMNNSNEVMFATGIGLGGAIIGLAPYLNDQTGDITFLFSGLAIGLLLIVTCTIGRMKRK